MQTTVKASYVVERLLATNTDDVGLTVAEFLLELGTLADFAISANGRQNATITVSARQAVMIDMYLDPVKSKARQTKGA